MIEVGMDIVDVVVIIEIGGVEVEVVITVWEEPFGRNIDTKIEVGTVILRPRRRRIWMVLRLRNPL